MAAQETQPEHDTSSPRDARRVLLEMAVALHSFGTPSHQLEELMARLAARLQTPASFFAVPTAIFAQFERRDPSGTGPEVETHMRRIEPGVIELGKLAAVHQLYDELVADEVGLREAERRLWSLQTAAVERSAWMSVLAFCVAAAAAARLFGGAANEILVAALIGAAVGAVAETARRLPQLARLVEPLAALLAALLALLSSALGWVSSPELCVLAGLIVLLPGMALTQALAEIAHRNLASGTARLMGAAMTFLTLGVGAAIGRELAKLLPATAPPQTSLELPAWTVYVALAASAIALTTLFRAPVRDLPYVALAAFLAYYGVAFGTWSLGPELGAAVGAFAVALFANAYARIARRPAAIVLIPAFVLLVPGTLGFESLSLLIRHEAVDGIETAVAMAVVATGLVTGLLVANAVLPARAELRDRPQRFRTGSSPALPRPIAEQPDARATRPTSPWG